MERTLTAPIKDLVFREEFVKAFEAVTEAFDVLREENKAEFRDIVESISDLFNRVQEDTTESTTLSKKEMMDYCMAEMTRMMREHSAKMQLVDDKIDSVVDGQDADETVIVEKVLAQIPPPTPVLTPFEIRNKLEELKELPEEDKLDYHAIQGGIGIVVGPNPPQDKEMLWVRI